MSSKMIGYLSVFSLALVCLQATSIAAEEECINRSGHTIQCFNCDSAIHENCADPFNFTLPPEELPPLKTCPGCCVKIVEHAMSPKERVRRMCTTQLVVNYFIVDHVCMKEGNKKRGHACFCEEDMCNSVPRVASWAPPLLLTLLASFWLHIHSALQAGHF